MIHLCKHSQDQGELTHPLQFNSFTDMGKQGGDAEVYSNYAKIYIIMKTILTHITMYISISTISNTAWRRNLLDLNHYLVGGNKNN